MKISLYTTLEELANNKLISRRTCNALISSGLYSLGYVVDRIWGGGEIIFNKDIEYKLMSIPKLGKKSVYELESVFDLLSKTSLVSDTSIDNEDTRHTKNTWLNSSIELRTAEVDTCVDIDPLFLSIISASYNSVFVDDNTYTALIKNLYVDALEIHKVICNEYMSLYSFYPGFDIEGNITIRGYFLAFIRNVISRLLSNERYVSPFFDTYSNAERELKLHQELFTYTDIYTYLFDDVKKQFLQNLYIKLFDSELTLKTNHILKKKLPTLESILPFLDKHRNNTNELSKIISIKTDAYNELQKFCSLIIHHINNAISIDSHSLKLTLLNGKYPFLNAEECKFILEYEERNNSLPFFYILHRFFVSQCTSKQETKSRSIRLFCAYYGLLNNNSLDYSELATLEGLSKERIRQLCAYNNIKEIVSTCLQLELSNYNELFNKPFLLDGEPDLLKLKEDERLDVNYYVLGQLFCVLADFKYFYYKGFSVFINKRLFTGQSFEKILNLIFDKASSKIVVDEWVNVYSLFPKIKIEEKNLLFKAIRYFGKSNIILCDDDIVFKGNYINVCFEVIRILEHKKEPMYLNDIFSIFHTKFPEHSCDTPEKLRRHFSYPIRHIGNSAKFALDSWENICWGSIRDILIECLSKSKYPVHIDDLVEKVLSHYPNTNKKSIISTMSVDELNRFIQYEGGFYGLQGKEYPNKFAKRDIIHRYCFYERLLMFRDFIDSNYRFPMSNGEHYEYSLYCWYRNVLTRTVKVSDEQVAELQSLVDAYNQIGFPRTILEFYFQECCVNYRFFIYEHNALPDKDNGEELYYWFNRSKNKFDELNSKMRSYFEKLLLFISEQGLSK